MEHKAKINIHSIIWHTQDTLRIWFQKSCYVTIKAIKTSTRICTWWWSSDLYSKAGQNFLGGRTYHFWSGRGWGWGARTPSCPPLQTSMLMKQYTSRSGAEQRQGLQRGVSRQRGLYALLLDTWHGLGGQRVRNLFFEKWICCDDGRFSAILCLRKCLWRDFGINVWKKWIFLDLFLFGYLLIFQSFFNFQYQQNFSKWVSQNYLKSV